MPNDHIELALSKLFDSVNGLNKEFTDRMARLETKVEAVVGKVDSIEGKVDTMQSRGCARYPEHVENKTAIQDQEGRLRTLESDKNKILGAAAALGATVGGAASWFVGIFTEKGG
jgi:hypothetical protein